MTLSDLMAMVCPKRVIHISPPAHFFSPFATFPLSRLSQPFQSIFMQWYVISRVSKGEWLRDSVMNYSSIRLEFIPQHHITTLDDDVGVVRIRQA